jgi:hypothetical protein
VSFIIACLLGRQTYRQEGKIVATLLSYCCWLCKENKWPLPQSFYSLLRASMRVPLFANYVHGQNHKIISPNILIGMPMRTRCNLNSANWCYLASRPGFLALLRRPVAATSLPRQPLPAVFSRLLVTVGLQQPLLQIPCHELCCLCITLSMTRRCLYVQDYTVG